MYYEMKSDKSMHTPTNTIILYSLNAQEAVIDEGYRTMMIAHRDQVALS